LEHYKVGKVESKECCRISPGDALAGVIVPSGVGNGKAMLLVERYGLLVVLSVGFLYS
jgi:hypothetical protein